MAKFNKNTTSASTKEAKDKVRSILKNIKPIKITVFDSHRIIEAIKQLENNSQDVQAGTASGKIMSILIQKDENSIPFLVKLSILNASGVGGDPKDLKDETEISELIKDNTQFTQLRSFLIAIIQQDKPSATISINEIKSCSVVSDVVSLVTQKIS